MAEVHHTLAIRSVVTPSGCIEWTAAKQKRFGYGAVWFPRLGKMQLAHRVSYMLSVGEIPVGMCVLHRCDNPPCINPDHLFLGTCSDNIQDMIGKGRKRNATGQRHGLSKLTPEQVLAIRCDTRTMRVVAKDYGVGPTTIHAIRHEHMWKHLK